MEKEKASPDPAAWLLHRAGGEKQKPHPKGNSGKPDEETRWPSYPQDKFLQAPNPAAGSSGTVTSPEGQCSSRETPISLLPVA